ncbi:MAG: M24 family metallopeptidase [Oscillospiraceae bacterium]|nr:M24 family metallopeptidase [Oscillospiraceae bacterium]
MNRLKYPMPKDEMARRQSLTAQKMKEAGIDCLVMYNCDRLFAGALRYLTDLCVHLYPVGALFSADGDACYFGSGAKGGGAVPPFAAQGAKANMALPFLPSCSFTDHYVPEEMYKIIKAAGYKRLGFCYLNLIPAALYNYLRGNLPDAQFVDASDMMDHIQAVKSPYELKMYQLSVDIHDKLMAAVPSVLRVGRTEREVTNDIRTMAQNLDCEDLNILVGSSQAAPNLGFYLYQNKVIEKGDHFYCLIEVSAPGGFWAECGRVFSLGRPSPEMEKASEDAIKLQQYFLPKMVPGASPAAIYDELNELLTKKGYAPELRFFAHGQGYDIVSRPNFVPGETMALAENMFIAHHPTCVNKKVFINYTDNFVITKNGAVRMSKTPQQIFII